MTTLSLSLRDSEFDIIFSKSGTISKINFEEFFTEENVTKCENPDLLANLDANGNRCFKARV